MSLLEKIRSDSVYSTLTSGLALMRGLVVIPLVTKLLGTAQFGVWAMLLTLVTVLKTLGGVHLHGAVIRYGQGDRRPVQSYANAVVLTAGLAVLVGGGCLLAISVADVASLLGASAPRNTDGLLLAATALVVSEMFYAINVTLPRSLGDIRRYERLRVARLALEVAVLAVVFVGGGGLFGGVVGLLAVNVGLNAVLVIGIQRRHTVPRPEAGAFRQYLRFGLPMVPKDLSGYVLTHSDRYLLLLFLSPTAVGVYTVAHGIGSMLERAASVLNPTMYPTITSAWEDGQYGEIRDAYATIFRYYTMGVVPALVGLTLLAGPLLRVVSTPAVARRGALLVPIVTLAFIFRGYATVVEYVLTAAEETDKMALATGTASVLNVGLNLLAIPTLGIAGAAAATLLAQFVFTALVYWYAAANVAVPLPSATLVQSVAAAGVMGAVLVIAPLPGGPARLLLYPLVGCPIYVAAMLTVGGVTVEELAAPVGRS